MTEVLKWTLIALASVGVAFLWLFAAFCLYLDLRGER